MILEATMSIRTKREFFQIVNLRYHKAGKVEKGKILDEFSIQTGRLASPLIFLTHALFAYNIWCGTASLTARIPHLYQ